MTTTKEELVLVCSCTSLNHVVRFSYWDEDGYISVLLCAERSWWKRLKTSIAYLFRGHTCRYGDSAEVVLSPEDYPKLRTWLDGAEKHAVTGYKRNE